MLRNTRERWGSVSIALHWTIAALVLLVQVPAGITALALDPGNAQDLTFNIHKTNGMLIFLLAVFRLFWRWTNPVPALPADLPTWQRTAARVSHAILYVLLFAMPISGFLYTTMGGFPAPFFMLVDLGPLVPENEAGAATFRTIHLTLQWLLYAALLLHVAAALQHHLVRKDWILRRMLSSTAPLRTDDVR
jgi:cytochrome b561